MEKNLLTQKSNLVSDAGNGGILIRQSKGVLGSGASKALNPDTSIRPDDTQNASLMFEGKLYSHSKYRPSGPHGYTGEDPTVEVITEERQD